MSFSLVMRRGASGFSVLRFWLYFKSVIRFLCQKNFGFSVLVFVAVYAFSVFWHLVFAFRENY